MAAFEIPALIGFRTKKFDLSHAQQTSPIGTRGFVQTIQRSAPFWYAEYETPPLEPTLYNEMEVFLDALDGAIGTFLAYDPRRIMPFVLRTQAVGTGDWGSPVVAGSSYSASTLDIHSLNNSQTRTITKGDLLSCQDDNGSWHLFRAMQTRNSDGSGIIDDLIVRPRPLIEAAAPLALRYQKPVCEMKLVGKPNWSDAVDTFPSVSFTAGQFIQRVPD